MIATAEQINELCKRLSGLLDDPHPGLMTWLEARIAIATELRAALNSVLDAVTEK